MTQVYVAEFPGLFDSAQGDSVDILPYPPTAEYVVLVSAAANQGPAFNSSTKVIEVSADTTCSVRIVTFGVNTATITNARMQANERKRYGVPPVWVPAAGVGAAQANMVQAASYAISVIANT